MKYVILIMNTDAANGLSEAEQQAWYAEVGAWYEKGGGGSGKLAETGYQLQPPATARTVRASGVTDGPFVETKEHLGGLAIMDVADEDQARYWAGRIAVAVGWPQELHRFPHRTAPQP
jgi:hypothetical protein